ncbi:helix-turn-helix domain-containing protein [uncultured Microbulbifer sp.]|uniref:helix-turn-helix domain-containing protein n=1 Tax=uncultured Microbulbifer sp. TaxID=348147 RepID=UPI002629BFEA|nr:helix-turn-helix domain-containing protein [uncultured Microbulbifer sp.]
MPKSIGIRVRNRAKALNLTQNDIATHLGVSRDFVARLYAGKKRGLSFEQLDALCHLLELDTNFLLGRNSTPNPLSDEELGDLLNEIGAIVSTKINKC